MPKIIIAGCGFLGEAAAVLFSDLGWNVLGLCASEETAARLSGGKFAVQVRDITEPFTMQPPWHDADALIHCASSGRRGVDAYRSVYLEGLLNAMTAIQPRRTLFVSSTSVYGQTDGGEVTETSETSPTRETGRILLDAEGVALASGGYVARLSGLYGPGRSVLLERYLAGEPVIEEGGTRLINQIHRDDAARALAHLFTHRAEPGIYNVTDDHPATQKEIAGWLEDYFRKPASTAEGAYFAAKRARTHKRVSNEKLRSTGWSPLYPSFRDALPSLSAV